MFLWFISDFEHHAINAKYILKMEVGKETEHSMKTLIIRAVHLLHLVDWSWPKRTAKKSTFKPKKLHAFVSQFLNRATPNQNNDAIFELLHVRNLYLNNYLLSSNTYIVDIFVDLLHVVHLKTNCNNDFQNATVNKKQQKH